MSIVRLGISIPTYNEAVNIKTLLRKIKEETSDIRGLDVRIVVVDDMSPDGTADIVRRSIETLDTNSFHIELLSRAEKNGFGKACIAGFKQLIKQNVDFILQMDADMSHDPIYIPTFINKASAGHDFVIGTRYIAGGGTPDWPWHRRALSRYGNIYTKTILSRSITDYTGGYNLYSKELLEKINLDSLRAGGYGFLIELKYRALQDSKNFAEVPIIFRDRVHGKSKMPKSTILKNLVLVQKVKAQNFKGRK